MPQMRHSRPHRLKRRRGWSPPYLRVRVTLLYWGEGASSSEERCRCTAEAGGSLPAPTTLVNCRLDPGCRCPGTVTFPIRTVAPRRYRLAKLKALGHL